MKKICNGKIDNSGMCEKCFQISQTTSGYCTRFVDVEPAGQVGEEAKCPKCGDILMHQVNSTNLNCVRCGETIKRDKEHSEKQGGKESVEELKIIINLQKRLETLINMTPSGVERNMLCEENIKVLEYINKS